jgi:hypothetical protein
MRNGCETAEKRLAAQVGELRESLESTRLELGESVSGVRRDLEASVERLSAGAAAAVHGLAVGARPARAPAQRRPLRCLSHMLARSPRRADAYLSSPAPAPAPPPSSGGGGGGGAGDRRALSCPGGFDS